MVPLADNQCISLKPAYQSDATVINLGIEVDFDRIPLEN